jgi:hypothetical protein
MGVDRTDFVASQKLPLLTLKCVVEPHTTRHEGTGEDPVTSLGIRQHNRDTVLLIVTYKKVLACFLNSKVVEEVDPDEGGDVGCAAMSDVADGIVVVGEYLCIATSYCASPRPITWSPRVTHHVVATPHHVVATPHHVVATPHHMVATLHHVVATPPLRGRHAPSRSRHTWPSDVISRTYRMP